jgi:hypothetical protein
VKQHTYEGGAAAGGPVVDPLWPGTGGMNRGIYACHDD